MLQDGRAWFLLADGRRARLLVEERRGAELQEAWTMEIGSEDLYQPQDRPARSHDSVGPGRHAMDRGHTLHEQEEDNFLHRLADRVGEAEAKGAFDHLVVAAAPRALGVLRDAFKQPVQARLRATASKDLIDEEEAPLRARLRELLR